MEAFLDPVLGGLDMPVAIGLFVASFASSFMAIAFGMGGGTVLLAILANFLPAAALIPVHGVIQLGSNAFRAVLMSRYAVLAPVASFAVGSILGVAIGGSIVVNLSAAAVQAGVGLFVIYSVLFKPPKLLSRAPVLTGGVSSFLTMFFGATGIFVANFVKSLSLPRENHVATHAILMSMQHGLKILVFGLLGFAYGPWIGFTLAMIATGFLGTLAGRLVLKRMSDTGFKRIFDVLLVLIALRLIWGAVQAWLQG